MTRELSFKKFSNQKSKAGTIPVELLLRFIHSSAQAVLEKIVIPGILFSKALSTFMRSTPNMSERTQNSPCSQSRFQSTPDRRPSLGSPCLGHETFRSLHRIIPSAARTSGFRTQIFHTYLRENQALSRRLRIVAHTTRNPFKRRISRAILSLRLVSSPPLTSAPIVRPELRYNMHSTGMLQSMEHRSPASRTLLHPSRRSERSMSNSTFDIGAGPVAGRQVFLGRPNSLRRRSISTSLKRTLRRNMKTVTGLPT
jgi:hypothetical protein